jgi:hypothetical protein
MKLLGWILVLGGLGFAQSDAATVAQSVRPFPQFSSGLTPSWAPLGKTWYDSLQIKATKRLSHGLDFTYAFSFQKSLNMGSESDGGTAATVQVNDVYNRPLNKILSSLDQKFAQVIAAIYTSPKWGRNKFLSCVVSDWEVGVVLNYASGLPILSPLAQNNLNPLLFRGGNATLVNRVAGVPLLMHDLNCGCFDPNTTFVLNPRHGRIRRRASGVRRPPTKAITARAAGRRRTSRSAASSELRNEPV